MVLVAPLADISLGFSEAEKLLRGGQGPVWLIGRGVTTPGAWPSWVATASDLTLTEIAALRAKSRFESTAQLTEAIRQWLDEWLDGIIPAPASERFYHAAYLRMFQPLLDNYPYADGCARALAGHRVTAVGAWSAWNEIEQRLAASGGALVRRAPRDQRQRSWRMGAPTAGVALTSAVIAQHVRDWFLTATSRKTIDAAKTDTVPDFWVGLVPTWERMNRVLLESVIEPAVASGANIGTLCVVELFAGSRDEHDLTKITPTDFGVGFGSHRAAMLRRPIEQLVTPTSVTELLEDISIAAARAAKAVRRLKSMPSTLVLGGVPVEYDPLQLARLASIDLCRATFAERSVQAFLRRTQYRKTPVVLCTSASLVVATACGEFRKHDVPVLEVVHGTVGEGLPGQDIMASTVLLPTLADARAIASLGRQTALGGMPRYAMTPARPAGKRTRNVLLLSNYLHRDYIKTSGNYLRHILDEFLRTATLLRESGESLNIRWRPHPADMPEYVAQAHAARPWMELSPPNRKLAVDLEWCDVAVTTPSSSIAQALFAGVPVFQHAEAEYWRTAVADWMDRSRLYFYADEGAKLLLDVLHALEAGDPRSLAPEESARIALFGDAGTPPSTIDIIHDLLKPGRSEA